MKKTFVLTIAAIMAMIAGPVMANSPPPLPIIGNLAPAIVAKDTNGKDVDVSVYKGKIVVLEWTNNGCPFVKKHYGSKNMQAVQKDLTDKGVIWISVISSAPGKEGHVDAEGANKIVADAGATVTHTVLDPDGKIGKTYGAKTTPHMFVIGVDGNVAYMGAIDDNASADPATIAGAKNYVRAAVDALVAVTPVEVAQTQPYGCSVKY